MGAIRGARSELRRQIREQQRLRMLMLMAIVVAVLGALPLYLLLQASAQDPVFTSLDELKVPSWAAGAANDEVAGNRWCIIECRFRERDVPSQKAADETNAAYVQALQDAGWVRWKPAQGCPAQEADGHYTCWQRDEYTLDLWVRAKPCSNEQLGNQSTVPSDPSAGPAAGAAPDDCSGSMVSFKVYNAIADERLTAPNDNPQPSGSP
jgi:integrin beta 3